MDLVAYRIEVRGGDVLGGGSTPDELYGEGVWGPAVFGVVNRTGLSDVEASTFTTEELAQLALLALVPLLLNGPTLETQIVEVV